MIVIGLCLLGIAFPVADLSAQRLEIPPDSDLSPVNRRHGVISGPLRQWHRITITFDGPQTSEDAPRNPFTDFRLDVTFSNGQRRIVVPGFYAADGNAAHTGASAGNKWRVHFMPDRPGFWTYTASFRRGPNVAIADDRSAGRPVWFDGASGSFMVRPTNKTAPDFRARGLLHYAGEHYMRFAGTGERFLKMGAGSPENFLAYHEFDGTYDTGGLIPDFLHEYTPHIQDWRPGDPTWGDGRGKGIIGALNYLASQGGNSVYFLTYTLDGGDGMDVWPWTSHTVRDRFDVSKLDQWEIVFSHMTRLGIQLHLLLQEQENDLLLGGSPDLNDVRRLYHRELIARFAHHPALQWNVGEENNLSTAQKLAVARHIRRLDPYKHPITVHSYFNLRPTFTDNVNRDVYYDDLLGRSGFEATSIQGQAIYYNQWAVDLRRRSAEAGRPWVIYADEQSPAVAASMGNVGQIVRDGLWGNLMGGGAGVEWYFGYQGDFGDLQSEDWRVAEPLWARSRHALTFFHTYLPFWNMQPDNALVGGNAWTLARPGRVYAVYFRSGVSGQPNQLDLGNSPHSFSVRWFDPINGGPLQIGSVRRITGPGIQALGLPPHSAGREWAVVVRRVVPTP